MGCLSGRPKGEHRPVPTEENTLKVLCLGVGGCGKTTFVKQMKIIHGVAWSDVEYDAYSRIIRGNYVNGLQECLNAAQNLGLKLNPANAEHAQFLLTLRARNVDLTPDILERLTALWQDPAVKEIVKNHPELLTITHLPYFFENIDRIRTDPYQPTDEDILRCRQRTAGASSCTVYIDKNYFEFFDIGGQKPERAKWEQILTEHSFSSVIYFVAADEFDVEDEDKEFQRTKMEISRFVFSEIVNSNVVPADVPIMLFINRRDLFEDRISDNEGFRQFCTTFPEYQKGPEVNSALEFIKEIFITAINDPANSNPVKFHYTCALDTESMIVVWHTVREFLLKRMLKDIGVF